MRCRCRRLLVAAFAGTVTLAVGPGSRAADEVDARAPDAPSQADAARRAQPLATVGSNRMITVGEVEDRLAALPPFQRATFGADGLSVARAFVLQVLIPEALFAQKAAAEKLDRQLPTAFEVERALSDAALRAIRRRVGPATAIPMSDVQAYYDANRDRYDTPERIQLWRILCKTRDEAQTVLQAAEKDPTFKSFGELTREHSIDKATNLRDGNLGFVNADGTSNEPGLSVDPRIVRAAQSVRDGQFVPTPVPEGEAFAVVWRRGTIAATKRTVEDAAAQIRDTLWKSRVKAETDALIASLRAAKLRDFDDSSLSLLSVPPPDAGPIGLRTSRTSK